MRRSIKNMVVGLVLLPTLTIAQEKLTHAEAVKIALNKNVALNQQKNNLFSSQVQRNQNVSAFLPSVNVRGTAQRTQGLQQSRDGGDLIDVGVNEIFASLNADLVLFNGLNRLNTLFQNNNNFKAQTSLVERTKQDVIYNVTTQYLQVLLDQELYRIAEENYKAQNSVLDQLKEQVNVGSRAEANLYTQEALVLNLKVTALRSKVTLENDKAVLAQTLQLEPSQVFDVEFPEIQNLPQVEGMSMDSLYSLALNSRQDYKRAKYQVTANQRQYQGALSGYAPTVALFATYGSYYTSQLEGVPLYGSFSNQFGKAWPQLQYGVNVTIPIFDRMVTRNNRALNKVRYENSRLEEENLERSIKIDVQRAYNNFKAAMQAHEASLVQIKAGQLALKTQQESFLLGAADQAALSLANQTYVQAAASKAQAEVTLLFQKILLDYALGTLKPEEVNN